MATSGTATFNLDLTEIVEDAFERCGLESRSGYDYRTARRSMDLLGIEWQNRGTNLWTIEQDTITLVSGTQSYALDADSNEVIDFVVRKGTGTSQQDTPLERITVAEWAGIPNKNTTGRPSNVWLDKQIAAAKAYLWPIPNSGDYTLVYWQMRRIEDTGTPGSNNPDVPARFLNAFVSGLAYYISMKKPEAMAHAPRLFAEYDRQWNLATANDRDRSRLRLIPWVGSPYNG